MIQFTALPKTAKKALAATKRKRRRVEHEIKQRHTFKRINPLLLADLAEEERLVRVLERKVTAA